MHLSCQFVLIIFSLSFCTKWIVFLSIFYWLCYYSYPSFSPLSPLCPAPQPSSIPPLSSCPWVVHISSLFPIPFLISPYLFMTTNYVSSSLYISPQSSRSPPRWNPSVWYPFLWFCSCSGGLLSFCFHCFSFLLGSFVDGCEFVVILLFIFSIFFFLDKSL